MTILINQTRIRVISSHKKSMEIILDEIEMNGRQFPPPRSRFVHHTSVKVDEIEFKLARISTISRE